ncbi:hypothetical protein [Microbacterium sp.]|uniref:hypothetical protein n=1 Tax=Microbacterium sp. TaxID=51671 RepID=UPI0039E48407
MDLHRDRPAAFGPDSVAAGSLLPFEGRTLITRADGLPPAVLDAERDGWLSPENPILVRGQARILPLAWRADPAGGGGTGVSPEEIAAFASAMHSAGMYWAGSGNVPDLDERRSDSLGSYLAALRASGATRVHWWTYSEATGIALVWAGAEAEGTMSLALHVVPAGWVSEPRAGTPVSGIDLRWSWADVVMLFAGRDQAADRTAVTPWRPSVGECAARPRRFPPPPGCGTLCL